MSLDTAARIQRRGFTDLEVGGRVGARKVLGGSLIVSGNRLRVTVNLNHVGSERQLWSAKHDFATGQVLDLHTLLSETIVQNLYDRLGGLEDPQTNACEFDQASYHGQPQLGFSG